MSTISAMPKTGQFVPGHISAYQRIDIAAALRQVRSASELYWNSMSAEEFVRPLGIAWSPADNVRHLTKSVRAVLRGMQAPKLLLRLFFGRATRTSRSYESMVAAYHEALRRGGKAGRYAPSPSGVSTDFEAYRRHVLDQHHEVVERLATRIMEWRRAQVDTVRVPHPLLGRITVREMLLFTLYHNLHHVHVVARRRGEWFSDETPLSG
jgi:hypothetical protein